MIKRTLSSLFAILLSALFALAAEGQDDLADAPYLVEPGDSWETLAWRFGVEEADLRALNPHPNRQRQPAIGSTLMIPSSVSSTRAGEMVRFEGGGLMQLAAEKAENAWALASLNGLPHPFRPVLDQGLFIEGTDGTPRDLPAGFTSLELSAVPAIQGQAAAIRGELASEISVSAVFGGIPLSMAQEDQSITGIFGTGAFFPEGDYDLSIWVDQEPLWSQPWRLKEGSWTFEEIYLTGSAAAITQEAIAQERQRLELIWAVNSGPPLWDSPFSLPLHEFLQYSSLYGARRSYNGGPYRTYHEGLDFSALGGTPVYAPARGQVALAELLEVRGGAVIIDHGLGLHSGFYHMSEISVVQGQIVEANQEIGKVGSTGLSTGNHLHWDLLVGTTWIDPGGWIDSGISCWILSNRGSGCQEFGS